MKLIISPEAIKDLDEIWLYVAIDSETRADKLIEWIYKQCESLAEMPGMGKLRDALLPGLRAFPLGNYLIFYFVFEKKVEVVRILSGFRDIDALFT